MSQVVELAPGHFMCGLFGSSNLQVLRRSRKKMEEKSAEVSLEGCSDIMRMPEYDFNSFPYAILRTRAHILLVNVRSQHVYPLLADQKPNFDNEFCSVVASGKIEDGGTITIVFSSTKQDANTDTIKTLTLNNQFLLGLKHFSH